MAKKLTQKQAQFVKNFVETGNGTASAMDAYEATTVDSAANIASQNLNKPKIADEIEKALTKKGITADKIAQVIADGLEATKIGYDKENEEYFETGLPDHNARHKYLETVIEITGAKAPEKHEHKLQGVIAIDKIAEIQKRVFSRG